MSKQKKILPWPVALTIVLLAAMLGATFTPFFADAAGHIGWRNVSAELRTYTRDYPAPAVTALAASSLTAGTAGVIVVRPVTAVTSLAPLANTMTLPYPAKLKYLMSDNVGANDALACTSVIVRGRNQFGRPISETVSVNETESKGSLVFESIATTEATGCTAGTDAADDLRIRVSNEVGLPVPIVSEAAMLDVCVYDLSAVNVLCYAPATFVADLVADSIDFDNGLVTLAISDRMMFTVRAPAGE